MDLKILVGIAVICMFVLSATVYIADLQAKYGHTADLSDFNNTEYYLNKTYTATQESIDIITSEDDLTLVDLVSEAVWTIPWRIIKATWYSFRLVMLDIPHDAYKAFSRSVGYEGGWILNGIVTAIGASIVILIISLLLRFWTTR